MTPHTIIMTLLLGLSFNCWAEELTDPAMAAGYQANSSASTSTQQATEHEWVLNSTMISSHQKVAIINGKQVMLGEEINGATLISIDHQKVELKYQDQTISLSLQRSFISHIKQ